MTITEIAKYGSTMMKRVLSVSVSLVNNSLLVTNKNNIHLVINILLGNNTLQKNNKIQTTIDGCIRLFAEIETRQFEH